MLLIDWPTETFRNAEGEGVNHYSVTLRKALKSFRKEFIVKRNLVRMNFGLYSYEKSSNTLQFHLTRRNSYKEQSPIQTHLKSNSGSLRKNCNN